MKKIRNYVSASLGFLKMLVRARTKTTGQSVNGHDVCVGWPHSPDEDVVKLAVDLRATVPTVPRVALYCFSGPHAGELFCLSQRAERLASDTGASVVLTPSAGMPADASFRLLINGSLTLSSETTFPFRLNGAEEQKAEIYDYDELELVGNRCLVLVLPRSTNESVTATSMVSGKGRA
jgi:hypothetical protein